jgi:hypothetical protein
VAEVERYLTDPVELPAPTRRALARAELLLVQAEELEPERWEAERTAWLDHLGSLPEADGDAAEHELRKFLGILTWLRAEPGEVAEAE